MIDYRERRFEHAIERVDVVFDTISGDTLKRSWRLLTSNGRLVTIAAPAAQAVKTRSRDAFFLVEPNSAQLARVAEMLVAGHRRVFADTVFALADGRQAYQYKPARGKAVLRNLTEKGKSYA